MARKTKTEQPVFTDFYNNTLDTIAKRQGFESSSLEVTPPASTGLLCLDLILGGGLRPGMLTAAGNEQSAKTTVSFVALAGAIKSNVPIVGFVDYEGCFVSSSTVSISGVPTPLSSMFDLQAVQSLSPGWTGLVSQVDTVLKDGTTDLRVVELYYKGQCRTTVVELESGHKFVGNEHPMFCRTDRHPLCLKRLEDLVVGDQLLLPDQSWSPVVSVALTGNTEPVFDLGVQNVQDGDLEHSIIVNGIVVHNSSKSSKPYIQALMKTNGINMSMDDLFGRDAKGGQPAVPGRIRYRAEVILERFYEYLGELLRELPDKRFVENRWWLVFDEQNKKHKAAFGDQADKEMGRKYGKGLWMPAPDGKMQGFFVIDSYTAMNPEAKDKEDISNQLSVKASAFSKQLERIKGRLVQKMVLVYGINHLRSNPMAMYGPKEEEKGGVALRQFSDVRLRQTSRALSAAPFSPKAGKKMSDEQEPSVEFGGNDRYRYVHVKAVKNKLWVPQRETLFRIWVEDGSGTARGIDPVFDTINYLRDTGQLKGTRAALKLDLDGLGPAKRSIPWAILKKWILGPKDVKVKICQALGYPKPFDLRSWCFRQIETGRGEVLYVKTSTGAPAENESSEDDGEEE